MTKKKEDAELTEQPHVLITSRLAGFGLVCMAHRLLHHSTVGSRVTKMREGSGFTELFSSSDTDSPDSPGFSFLV